MPTKFEGRPESADSEVIESDEVLLAKIVSAPQIPCSFS